MSKDNVVSQKPKRGTARSRAGLLVTVMGLAGLAPSYAQDFPALPGKDWPMYGGSYNNQRFSTLTEVNTATAGKLEPKWVYHVNGIPGMESVPVVVNGVMYISGFNRIDALDARTGNAIWHFQRQPVNSGWQRGAAIANNKVYITTDDGHVLALDARTGAQLWESKGGPRTQFTGGAPIVADGKVLVTGNRFSVALPGGFVQAFNAETGDYLWTWNAMPAKGEPGYDTWGGHVPGGGPIWLSGAYDPQLKMVYYGTGQPNPQWNGKGRPGDNLYSDSIVALDVATGKMKWYFQNTPHDTHDYDSTEIIVLVDTVFKGKPRKLAVQANRNGFFYILDRTNGQFLQGTKFVSKVDWGTLDPVTGKATPDPSHEPTVKGVTTCPSTAGGTNWPSPAYNPVTGMFYLAAAEGCGINNLASSQPDSETSYVESPEDREAWQIYTRALDLKTGAIKWDYKQIRSNHYGPGMLTTAGGIVFSPEQFGQVSVLNAKTGKSLWHFNTGDLITASPVAYSVDGHQFFAVSAGTNVFAFGLGGK